LTLAEGAPPTPTPAPTATISCTVPSAPARVLRLVQPAGTQKYLADSHKSGIVDVKVYITHDGSVLKAVIVRSSGDAFLDGATYDAAVATVYVAEIRDCESVGGAYIYRARYNTDPAPEASPSPTPAPS
jgi:TonB family protein